MKARRDGWLLELTLFCLAACLLLVTNPGLASSAVGFEPGARAPGELRVVTWNLGTGVDAGTTALLDESIEFVAATLRELDADLVFLQELSSRRQLKELRGALGGNWTSVDARPRGTRTLAVLAQRGVLKREGRRSLERALAVSFESEGGQHLLCIGMHADAFSSRKRNQAIGRAAQFLESEGQNASTLLVGDLNLDLDIDKRRDLFTDDEHLDVETYNFLAQRMLDTGIGAGPTARPDRRIDYIFVEAAAFEVLAAGPWRGQRLAGMDHEPMVADLRLLPSR